MGGRRDCGERSLLRLLVAGAWCLSRINESGAIYDSRDKFDSHLDL